jgi:two-component system OmpR family sensor kinase
MRLGNSSRSISARTRILGAILAVACVGLAIVGGVTFIVQHERVLADVDQRLRTQVASLHAVAGAGAQSSGPSGTAGESLDVSDYTSVDQFLKEAVARLVPAQNEASLAVVDGVARYRPETLSGFDISGDKALITRAVAETTAAKTAVMGTFRTAQGSLRYIAIPVQMPGDPEHGVYIRAIDLDQELSPVTTSAITYAVAAVAMLIAIGVVGWFVVGRLLSPIRHLRETADSITLTELGARIPEQGNDDISDLTRTVNSMLDRLESSVDVQRQLLDDVRHELKTPITIVRGHLEMMDVHDAADVETTRDIGISELDRMTRLVEDIDLLAAVSGGEQLAMAEVDLDPLTRRVGELVSAIPQHRWVVQAVGEGVLVADPDRLLQAWLQLADNAAKYTPAGSTIEVGSAIAGDAARIWVADHGPGIPAAARHRIFRRFDRAEGKRSVGGSGLGLAIVDAIAKAHGGTCVVTDTPGGGATFTIQVPTGPSSERDLPAPVRVGDVLQREVSR